MQNFSEIALVFEEKTRKNVLHTYILRIDYNSPADFVSRAKKAKKYTSIRLRIMTTSVEWAQLIKEGA